MQNLFDFSNIVIALIPLVVGLSAVARQIGLNDKYSGLADILLGAALVSLTGVPWQAVIAQGIIVGLASSGLLVVGTKAIAASNPVPRISAQG